jgi:hypothetical protein
VYLGKICDVYPRAKLQRFTFHFVALVLVLVLVVVVVVVIVRIDVSQIKAF